MAGLIFLHVFLWVQYSAYQQGKAQWESLGDAHFYAKSAESWFTLGTNQWFELYPIALSKNSGIHMAFGAPGHSLVSSLAMFFGLSPQESVLFVSSCSIGLLVGIFFLWITWRTRSLPLALGGSLSLLVLKELFPFASSGGSDALGMLFFGVSLMALMSVRKDDVGKFYVMSLVFCILGALVRPQNQILLLSLPIWIFFQKKSKWAMLIWWLVSVFAWKLTQLALLQGETLSFPYSFSFLVGTEPYPGHHLFREYFSQGFGLTNVWEQRELWSDKLDVGWRLLKQYWTGWLPALSTSAGLVLFKNTRSLACQLSFVLGALVVLSATGHLVPRYWTFMQPMVLMLLFQGVVSIFSGVITNPSSRKWLWPFPIVILGGLLWQGSPWLSISPPRALNLHSPPATILRELSAPWLACDQPQKLIDGTSKPILLLPNTVELLNKISSEVQPVSEVLLSPQLEQGELKKWVTEQDKLLAKGFSLIKSAQGWKLYRGKFIETPTL